MLEINIYNVRNGNAVKEALNIVDEVFFIKPVKETEYICKSISYSLNPKQEKNIPRKGKCWLYLSPDISLPICKLMRKWNWADSLIFIPERDAYKKEGDGEDYLFSRNQKLAMDFFFSIGFTFKRQLKHGCIQLFKNDPKGSIDYNNPKGGEYSINEFWEKIPNHCRGLAFNGKLRGSEPYFVTPQFTNMKLLKGKQFVAYTLHMKRGEFINHEEEDIFGYMPPKGDSMEFESYKTPYKLWKPKGEVTVPQLLPTVFDI